MRNEAIILSMFLRKLLELLFKRVVELIFVSTERLFALTIVCENPFGRVNYSTNSIRRQHY